MLEIILLIAIALLLVAVLRSLTAILREISLARTGLFKPYVSQPRWNKWERCFGSIAFDTCKQRTKVSPDGLDIEISVAGWAVLYGNPKGETDGEIRRAHLVLRNHAEYSGIWASKTSDSIGIIRDVGFALEFEAVLDRDALRALHMHLFSGESALLGPELTRQFSAPVALSFGGRLHRTNDDGKLDELSEFGPAQAVSGFATQPRVSIPEDEFGEFLKRLSSK